MNSNLLQGLLGIATAAPAGKTAKASNPASGAEFGSVFRQALERSSSADIRLTAHAEKRIQERSIPFDQNVRKTLGEAMDELGRKGAKDSLVLTNEGAFVVNVPTRTLVTAMGIREMNDRIVTQIDSVSVKTR